MENDNDKYSKELNAAVRVVHMACSLCQKVQKQLLSSNSNQIKSKDDDSLVTVADWSVQATVSWMLSEAFGVQNVSIVAEEDAQTLSKPESSAQLEMVVSAVNECLAEAPNFGLKGPNKALGASQVLEAINRCNSTGGPVGRHWVLDPVDGTLGFVRGDQYAIALAMIDNGEVAIGVLGCPNYSVKDDSLVKYSQQHPVMSDMSSGEEGCVMYARKGSGKAWMQPLFHSDKRLELQSSARTIHVSSIDDPALATFCEPVEKTNSNHSFTAGIADSVGLSAIWCKLNLAQAAEIEPRELLVQDLMQAVCTRSAELISVLAFWKKRISDDEAIARGEAEIYMKFARSGYKEKIWDHAAGVLLVQEAGGVVTDAGGTPLDFSRGIYLEGLDRGIVACSGSKLHDKIIGAVYASWESSNL